MLWSGWVKDVQNWDTISLAVFNWDTKIFELSEYSRLGNIENNWGEYAEVNSKEVIGELEGVADRIYQIKLGCFNARWPACHIASTTSSGHDINSTTLEYVEQCANWCSETNDCVLWEFDYDLLSSNTCFLKSAANEGLGTHSVGYSDKCWYNWKKPVTMQKP